MLRPQSMVATTAFANVHTVKKANAFIINNVFTVRLGTYRPHLENCKRGEFGETEGAVWDRKRLRAICSFSDIC